MRRPSSSPSLLRSFYSTASQSRRKYSARPFYLCVLVLCLLAIVSFLGKGSKQYVEAANGENLPRRHLESLGAIQERHEPPVKREQEVMLHLYPELQCSSSRRNLLLIASFPVSLRPQSQRSVRLHQGELSGRGIRAFLLPTALLLQA